METAPRRVAPPVTPVLLDLVPQPWKGRSAFLGQPDRPARGGFYVWTSGEEVDVMGLGLETVTMVGLVTEDDWWRWKLLAVQPVRIYRQPAGCVWTTDY